MLLWKFLALAGCPILSEFWGQDVKTVVKAEPRTAWWRNTRKRGLWVVRAKVRLCSLWHFYSFKCLQVVKGSKYCGLLLWGNCGKALWTQLSYQASQADGCGRAGILSVWSLAPSYQPKPRETVSQRMENNCSTQWIFSTVVDTEMNLKKTRRCSIFWMRVCVKQTKQNYVLPPPQAVKMSRYELRECRLRWDWIDFLSVESVDCQKTEGEKKINSSACFLLWASW